MCEDLGDSLGNLHFMTDLLTQKKKCNLYAEQSKTKCLRSKFHVDSRHVQQNWQRALKVTDLCNMQEKKNNFSADKD